MEWTDEAIVLGVRRHGEANAIVELLTRRRGRHLGLVRGGASRKQAPMLQPGNTVSATWRARLEEQLGNFSIEPVVARAEALMNAPHAAYGLAHMAQLLRLLPERDPHEGLFASLNVILDVFEDPAAAGMLLARFELALLAELGFGLELEACAATGRQDDLIYVSPKSGRAVCREAGAPYHERMLPLPGFLKGEGARPACDEVEAGLKLTGYFLSRRALEPRGLGFSEARGHFIAAWRRGAG